MSTLWKNVTLSSRIIGTFLHRNNNLQRCIHREIIPGYHANTASCASHFDIIQQKRNINCTRLLSSESANDIEKGDFTEETEKEAENKEKKDATLPGGGRKRVIKVDPETSIQYMQSKAFELTYGGELVWLPYRRNYRGQFRPKDTKRFCIKFGILRAGNPCPVCRDEFLVVHYTNTELLKQFLNPFTGEVRPMKQTQVCQDSQKRLKLHIQLAYDKGYLEMRVPFRKYDYSDYYPNLKCKHAYGIPAKTDSE